MLKRLGRLYSRIVKLLTLRAGDMAGLCALAMTLFITLDVFLRRAFNMPTIWANEASSYLLLVMVFMGAAYALGEKAHIRIDFIVVRLPRRVQDWMQVFSSIIFLIFTGILSYFTWSIFLDTVKFAETSRSLWDIPLAPWQVWLPLGLAIISLLLILNIYNEIKIARGKTKERPEEGAISEIL